MLLEHATSIDKILGGRVQIEQPLKGYRSAIDPILLAAAIPAQPGEMALELGLGAGAASLCLLARVPEIKVTGLERDPSLSSLARKNAALNNVADRLTVIENSIGSTHTLELFDHVFANPPYHDTVRHDAEAGPSHMPQEDLPEWTGLAFNRLKTHGSFTLIHRADALVLILNALSAQAWGAIKILPLCPRATEPAKRIIVSARKNRKTPLEILSPLVLHRQDGSYEEPCAAILKDGAALAMGD